MMLKNLSFFLLASATADASEDIGELQSLNAKESEKVIYNCDAKNVKIIAVYSMDCSCEGQEIYKPLEKDDKHFQANYKGTR